MMLERCPWYIAGPLLGLLLVLFRAGLNRPFGALGGYIELVERRRALKQLGPSAFILLGILLGGAIFAMTSGGIDPTLTYSSTSGFLPAQPGLAFIVLVTAGTVMGFGARTAGGCTSGHGLSGMSLGSPASMAATMTFFATAVVLAHVLAWLTGAAS